MVACNDRNFKGCDESTRRGREAAQAVPELPGPRELPGPAGVAGTGQSCRTRRTTQDRHNDHNSNLAHP